MNNFTADKHYFPKIHSSRVSMVLLLANIIMLIIYLSWWFHLSHVGNPYLYGLLLFGEVYHGIMALTFWHTLWPKKKLKRYHSLHSSQDLVFFPSVDIFITVAGEPVDVVFATAMAAKNINYPNKRIYILNDGFVAKKDNWLSIEKLADHLRIGCITRKIGGGAKAGNINHALSQTQGDIIVIFDADMVAHPDFLEKTLPYFKNPETGFVQTPQFYKNYAQNNVSAGAWEQQELFFGPIMIGKEGSNASFICGTNVAIRRQALVGAGGMNEKSIAEDFLTSLSIHQHGWRSYYLPQVLAEGLAPEDLLSYYKQQLRWARGSLEVLFSSNPLFKSSLNWHQKVEYISSALYYFNGVVVLIDILMPILFLLFGIQPVSATTTSFALYFIPFMALNLFTLYIVSAQTFSLRAISFSHASFTLQLQALFSVLTGQKMSFAVTPKRAQEGNFLFLVYPHLIYMGLFLIAMIIAVYREGLNPSVVTNLAWGLFNVLLFLPFINAAYPWSSFSRRKVFSPV